VSRFPSWLCGNEKEGKEGQRKRREMEGGKKRREGMKGLEGRPHTFWTTFHPTIYNTVVFKLRRVA